jgi:hypothetical protein
MKLSMYSTSSRGPPISTWGGAVGSPARLVRVCTSSRLGVAGPVDNQATQILLDREVETIRKIISKDGRHRLDIELVLGGVYLYFNFDDRYRDKPYLHASPEWMINVFSGLHEAVEALGANATAELVWLRE